MKAQLVGISPGLPRDDLARHPVGPAEVSRRTAEAVHPGLIGDQVGDGNLGDDCFPRTGVYAGTFGDT